jgi:hypothetical protein
MTKRNPYLQKISLCVLLAFSICNFTTVKAQVVKDTAKKLLLAVADKKGITGYIVKQANVVYPDLLCGVADNSADYIENFSINRREYIMRMHKKGKTFFTKAASILRKYKLPEEYKVLLALESAFNGNAVSKAGAVGYWQIMDEVAAEYGMKYAPQLSAAEKKKQEAALKKALVQPAAKKEKKPAVKDDRKNFLKSTYVAARYLKDRTRNLDNDPLLIVASYNCGVGNVWEAMKKTGVANPSFWDVKSYLPAETRSYVMNFITLNVIFNNYDKFVSNTLNFKPVKVKLGSLGADAAAAVAESIQQY